MQNLFISDVRLKNYKNIDEYIENIKFSQKLYPLFNFFEISLRNKLNNFYSEKFAHNWINEYRFKNIEHLLHKYIYRLDKDTYLVQMLKNKFNINIKPPTSL